jgi:uncharacterized membrane protein YhaH (DUF805 family)
MGFMEAVRTCMFEKFFTISGRARRSEYWYFILFTFLVYIAMAAIFFAVAGLRAIDSGELSAIGWIMIIIFGLIVIWMYVAGICAMVRRFHDRDMSGWWVLGVTLGGMIPYIGFLISIGALVLMALKGTEGENRFGPDPLNPHGGAEVFR